MVEFSLPVNIKLGKVRMNKNLPWRHRQRQIKPELFSSRHRFQTNGQQKQPDISPQKHAKVKDHGTEMIQKIKNVLIKKNKIKKQTEVRNALYYIYKNIAASPFLSRPTDGRRGNSMISINDNIQTIKAAFILRYHAPSADGAGSHLCVWPHSLVIITGLWPGALHSLLPSGPISPPQRW